MDHALIHSYLDLSVMVHDGSISLQSLQGIAKGLGGKASTVNFNGYKLCLKSFSAALAYQVCVLGPLFSESSESKLILEGPSTPDGKAAFLAGTLVGFCRFLCKWYLLLQMTSAPPQGSSDNNSGHAAMDNQVLHPWLPYSPDLEYIIVDLYLWRDFI